MCLLIFLAETEPTCKSDELEQSSSNKTDEPELSSSSSKDPEVNEELLRYIRELEQRLAKMETTPTPPPGYLYIKENEVKNILAICSAHSKIEKSEESETSKKSDLSPLDKEIKSDLSPLDKEIKSDLSPLDKEIKDCSPLEQGEKTSYAASLLSSKGKEKESEKPSKKRKPEAMVIPSEPVIQMKEKSIKISFKPPVPALNNKNFPENREHQSSFIQEFKEIFDVVIKTKNDIGQGYIVNFEKDYPLHIIIDGKSLSPSILKTFFDYGMISVLFIQDEEPIKFFPKEIKEAVRKFRKFADEGQATCLKFWKSSPENNIDGPYLLQISAPKNIEFKWNHLSHDKFDKFNSELIAKFRAETTLRYWKALKNVALKNEGWMYQASSKAVIFSTKKKKFQDKDSKILIALVRKIEMNQVAGTRSMRQLLCKMLKPAVKSHQCSECLTEQRTCEDKGESPLAK